MVMSRCCMLLQGQVKRLVVHINQKPGCVHLHRPRALILPVPESTRVGACLGAKAAAPAGGSAPSIPAVADASTQMELLRERLQCRVQAAECAWTFPLGKG